MVGRPGPESGVRSPESSVSDLSEPYLVQNPESRVRDPRKKMRGGGGYLARDSISRLNLGISGSIRSRSHELHNPESRVRTSGHSLSHPPRIHGPESGGAPAKSTGVRCAETRIQSPESTTEAEGRGADPQIPESGLRRHAQGSRGREGAQDTGSGLSGEGWRGAGPKGAGREGGDSGVN